MQNRQTGDTVPSRTLMIAGLSAGVLAVAAVIAGASGHDPTNTEVLRGVKITQRISVAAVKRSNTSRDLLKQIQADPSDPDAGLAVPNSRMVHPAYFVVFDENGVLNRSTLEGVQVTRIGVGNYLVATGRDISSCAWTASAHSGFSAFSTSISTTVTTFSTTDFARAVHVSGDPTNANRIGIRAIKNTGESVDTPMHVTIVC